MKKYLFLQIKRMLKFLPFVLIVTLVLMIGLSAALTGIIGIFSNKEEKQSVNIAVAGDTDNEYLKWGLSALQNLDETRFSINLLNMEEEDARKALQSGEITAYVVFPEDFVQNALHGDVENVRFVTTNGINDIVTLLQNELTQIITRIMIYSEKGVYGLSDAIYENTEITNRWDYGVMLSIEYVDLIIHRSDVYKVQELGFSAGLNLQDYFICGITLLLLCLMGLPYAVLFVKKDHALRKLMLSRGHSNFSQLLCEYTAHLAAMLLLTAFVLAALSFASGILENSLGDIISKDFTISFAKVLLPVLIMLSAFNILIFELADNMVSAVLLHFFSSLGLCYVAGCIYPIFTFPVIIQKISLFLPTGVAREHLASCFTGSSNPLYLAGIAVYSLVFFFVSLAVRTSKITRQGKG